MCVCVCTTFLYMCMYVYVSVYCVFVYVYLYMCMGMCDVSSPAFPMMYSAYKLNKQDDNIGITSWNQDCQEKYRQPQICRWYHSNGRKWRGTKEPLDEGERGEWKASLKLNIQKTKIMVSSITSWQTEGGKVEKVTNFLFLGSKITVDGGCSHERCLFLGRKAMTNLDSVLQSRERHLLLCQQRSV